MKKSILMILTMAVIGASLLVPSSAFAAYTPTVPQRQLDSGYSYFVQYEDRSNPPVARFWESTAPWYLTNFPNGTNLTGYHINTNNAYVTCWKYENGQWTKSTTFDHYAMNGPVSGWYDSTGPYPITFSNQNLYMQSVASPQRIDPIPSTNLYFTSNVSSWTPTWEGIKFTLPRDGAKDTTELFAFYTAYYVKADTPSQISIQYSGYTSGTAEMILSNNDPVDSHGYIQGYLNFTAKVPLGTSTITATITDKTGKQFTSSINVERLSGFIDSNSDGLDDRTGLPDIPKVTLPTSEQGTAAIPDASNALASAFSFVGNLWSVISQVFTVFPPYITGLLIFGVGLTIALRVLGR